ncbi:RDD family protein [Microbacterium sp. SORGH_AS_0888]|uniref:RDD family protein n=1 Tax=Microbacterium sp. SORGH_AS_0888 TaxID=3041791 RepID=UPI0027863ADF|nr:RDD family protein [Microbacterium sp. SORGH_AS_0888]MDQ1129589.1 putative RDD family membrane protein YckC [Microbacterium sp. SORGH_AS_0888]
MSLPPGFAGTAAGVGARVGAFSIDAVIVIALGALTAVLTRSLGFGALVCAEAVLALWVLQARTGSSPGKAMLRLRVSRTDAPYSPGAGRAFVRGSIVAMGALVFAAGAWIVEASGAWSRSRRSWHDQAAGTVVVVVPPRVRTRGNAAVPTPYAAPAPTVIARPWAPAAVAPTTDRGPAAAPPASSLPVAAPASVPPVAPSWGSPVAVARDVAAPPEPQAATTGSPSALLLVFDTGQREELRLPAAVVLGRNPSPVDDTDAVIEVADPDSSVSKNHVRLEHDREGLWITDLGSTNGTELVDDEGRARMLPSGQRTALDDGTQVHIGNRVFTVSRLMGTTA